MTSKELFYIEDALGHEQYFKTQFSETVSRIQDSELRSFAQDIQRQHQEWKICFCLKKACVTCICTVQ